jgi:N-acetylglutamate synthase
MKTRTMTIDDYEQVYDLWIHTSGMGLNSLDDSKEGIEAYLKRNPSTCFVAEEENRIIGVIICGHDGRRGFIYHTSVHNDFRKRGIAKELVERAMQALQKEGISKTALVVFGTNETGNSFWEKIGFSDRTDLVYRNKSIREAVRIDT